MNHIYQLRNDLYQFSISTNNSFGSHLHKQIEIICVISGSIEVTIGDEAKTLTPYDIAIIFPNTIHRYHTNKYSQMLLLIFDTELVSDFSYEFTNYKPKTPFLPQGVLKQEITGHLRTLVDYKNSLDIRIVKGYLNVVLGFLFQELNLARSPHLNDINLSQQLLMYLDENFTSNLSLDNISHHFGISKFYISHIFTDKLKISFTAYLNSLRINKAKQLLLTTNDSITDIAYASGYASLRTFFRKFQSNCHMTPKDFREKNGNYIVS